MELNWLRTFIAASQTRNFRKASEQLYISQPSVSVHIKQLEKSWVWPFLNGATRRWH
ncbi:LysR family transcriptional regulator [Rossellomorea sp. H39__3]